MGLLNIKNIIYATHKTAGENAIDKAIEVAPYAVGGAGMVIYMFWIINKHKINKN